MEKDWDNLIIADCGRYDYFRQLNHLSGDLTHLVSKGSNSEEFILNTFSGEEYYDTIYITANAHHEKLDNQVFFDVKRAYRGEKSRENIRKNADRLIELTIKLHNEYPHKRLITHFMHPHSPYVSQKAAKLRENVSSRHDITFKSENEAGKTDPADGLREIHSLLTASQMGLISNEQLQSVYAEDYTYLLESVEELIDQLDGKTAITADHGEMLGERLSPLYLQDWGHGHRLYSEELRKVPWFVVNNGDRRDIKADQPKEIENMDEETLQEHLKAMGYI